MQHDGKKDVLIDEPYFAYDSPKNFVCVTLKFIKVTFT